MVLTEFERLSKVSALSVHSCKLGVLATLKQRAAPCHKQQQFMLYLMQRFFPVFQDIKFVNALFRTDNIDQSTNCSTTFVLQIIIDQDRHEKCKI